MATSTIQKQAMVQAGTITGGNVSANSKADWTVTFDKEFASAPYVVVGFVTNADQGGFGKCCCAAVLSSISTTGFTVRIYNGDTSGRSPKCHWIAAC